MRGSNIYILGRGCGKEVGRAGREGKAKAKGKGV
jgi:hypothetical protein